MKHWWLAVFLVTSSVFPLGLPWDGSSAAVAAEDDPREVSARAKFAAGDYRGAVDLFAQLFAETNDPVFLRNIGRCHQKLQAPERAIESFREYLRRGKRISKKERAEVDGFIAEMQKLQAEQRKTAAANEASREEAQAAKPAVNPSPAPPDLLPQVRATPDDVALKQTVEPAADGPPEATPFYKRWWFWTAVGAVVVAGGAAVALAPGEKACGDGGRTCLR